MDARAMAPLGAALRSYLEGDWDAVLVLRRDDGVESAISASAFFLDPLESSDIDRTAIELARGRVLDAGAGSGRHASSRSAVSRLPPST